MNLNPYLFLLLKNLIKLEVELKTGESPIIENIKTFIAEREGATDDEKSPVSVAAWAVAEYIRKMWSKKVFKFPEFYLDRMALSLEIIGKYSSWKDFTKRESEFGLYQRMYSGFGKKYRKVEFESLDPKIRQVIEVMANRRAADIFFQFGSRIERDDAKIKIWKRKVRDWEKETKGVDQVYILSKKIDVESMKPLDQIALTYLANQYSLNG